MPEYATSQVLILTENKPYNVTEQSITSIFQQSKYATNLTTYIPPYNPPPMPQGSQFKKKCQNNPPPNSTANPTAVTKVVYELNQLAPFQSQSIQFNQLPPPNANTVVHVGQPILANIKLAPMITSNAVPSRDNNAHLFTDPKLLNMMRADLKRF